MSVGNGEGKKKTNKHENRFHALKLNSHMKLETQSDEKNSFGKFNNHT